MFSHASQHPDPKGQNLMTLARALRGYMKLYHDEPGLYAVFLDFASLHQKGPHGEARTDAQAFLFGRALGSLSEWYSHPNTTVFKLTTLPVGYPDGFHFPAGVTPNTADYSGRGWVSGWPIERRSLHSRALTMHAPVSHAHISLWARWDACSRLRCACT